VAISVAHDVPKRERTRINRTGRSYQCPARSRCSCRLLIRVTGVGQARGIQETIVDSGYRAVQVEGLPCRPAHRVLIQTGVGRVSLVPQYGSNGAYLVDIRVIISRCGTNFLLPGRHSIRSEIGSSDIGVIAPYLVSGSLRWKVGNVILNREGDGSLPPGTLMKASRTD
jgi:hypothetical protein